MISQVVAPRAGGGFSRVEYNCHKRGMFLRDVPNGFAIQEGQTEYLIELGPNWKPRSLRI